LRGTRSSKPARERPARTCGRAQREAAAIDAGLSQAAAARHFGNRLSAIKRWRQRHRAGDSLTPRRPSGRSRRIGPAHEAVRRAQLQVYPAATLAEHCSRWEAAQGVRVSRATMLRALARLR
jgi:transposase